MRPSTILPLVALAALACRGADGTLSSTESLAEGDANCAAGGVAIHFGIDDNRDGELAADERDGTPVYVCNGTSGTDGTNGIDGSNGEDAGAFQIIDTDTAWTADTSIDVPTIVMAGSTLTVSPGIDVQLMPGGSLHVEGAIVFEGDSSTPGATVRHGVSFAGGAGNLYATGTADSSVFDYVTFQDVGLILEGAATASITGATFTDSSLQVWDRASAFAISDSTIQESPEVFGVQLMVRDVPSLTVDNVEISGGGTGLQFEAVQDATLVISDSSFTGVGNAITMAAYEAAARIDADLSGLTFQDIGIRGVVANRADLSMTNATFDAVTLDAVFGDATVSADLTGLTINDANGDCITVSGPLTVADSTLTDCSLEGIQGGSELTVTNTSITNARHGIWYDFLEADFDTPVVSISGVTITNAVLRGIHVANYTSNTTIGSTTVDGTDLNECILVSGSADLDTVTAQNCASHGVRVGRGGTANAVTTETTFGGGLRFDIWEADVTITNATVSNAGLDGIYSGGTNTSIDHATVTGTGDDGIEIRTENANVTNATVTSADRYGIYLAGGGDVTQCAVDGAANWGVYIDAVSPSLVDLCDVTNGGSIGVVGHFQGGIRNGSLLTVSNSNLMGNADRGVGYAKYLDGNFLADNAGFTGADTTVAGTEDDLYNAHNDQSAFIDVILSAASEAVTGTGPQN